MTTSDEEPTARQDDPLAETTHTDPLYTDALAGDVAAAPPARWPLAVLAAIVVALLGVALWAVAYMQLEREYVGVSVIIGLAVGWVVRVVSRRSTIAARVVAVVVTAVACVLGTVVGEVAFTAKTYQADFGKLLGDVLPDTFRLLQNRPPLTFVIFAAALLLAWLSAGPQKEKPAKKTRGVTRTATVPPASDEPPPGSDEPPSDPRITAG